MPEQQKPIVNRVDHDTNDCQTQPKEGFTPVVKPRKGKN